MTVTMANDKTVNNVFVRRASEAGIKEAVEISFKNADEFQNHMLKVLKGYSNANGFVKKASAASTRSAINIYESSGNYQKEEGDRPICRMLTLKTIFIRSMKNKDGSFNVKYCPIIAKKEAVIFDNAVKIVNDIYERGGYDLSGDYIQFKHAKNPWSRIAIINRNLEQIKLKGLTGGELQGYVNEMVQATNEERLKVIEWFKYFSSPLLQRIEDLEHEVEELKERLKKYDKLIKA